MQKSKQAESHQPVPQKNVRAASGPVPLDTVFASNLMPQTVAVSGNSAAATTQLRINLNSNSARANLLGAQKKEVSTPIPRPNYTGLPDTLKSGIESLSGMSMDHVKVHYNSQEPANINAYAYAQGSDIHLAPGQEQHLPHEAWHVVQQAQGRVNRTIQMASGISINDEPGLEQEADVMGLKALECPTSNLGERSRIDESTRSTTFNAPFGDLKELITQRSSVYQLKKMTGREASDEAKVNYDKDPNKKNGLSSNWLPVSEHPAAKVAWDLHGKHSPTIWTFGTSRSGGDAKGRPSVHFMVAPSLVGKQTFNYHVPTFSAIRDLVSRVIYESKLMTEAKEIGDLYSLDMETASESALRRMENTKPLDIGVLHRINLYDEDEIKAAVPDFVEELRRDHVEPANQKLQEMQGREKLIATRSKLCTEYFAKNKMSEEVKTLRKQVEGGRKKFMASIGNRRPLLYMLETALATDKGKEALKVGLVDPVKQLDPVKQVEDLLFVVKTYEDIEADADAKITPSLNLGDIEIWERKVARYEKSAGLISNSAEQTEIKGIAQGINDELKKRRRDNDHISEENVTEDNENKAKRARTELNSAPSSSTPTSST